MSPLFAAVSTALLAAGLVTFMGLLAAGWVSAERRAAYVQQALEDVLRWQRVRRQQWHPDRARLHYGIPCADESCDCRRVAA